MSNLNSRQFPKESSNALETHSVQEMGGAWTHRVTINEAKPPGRGGHAMQHQVHVNSGGETYVHSRYPESKSGRKWSGGATPGSRAGHAVIVEHAKEEIRRRS